MKKLLLTILLFTSILVKAQEVPSPFEFRAVDTTLGDNKGILFVRAVGWLNGYYNSAKAVTQFSDKETGKIIGKGYFTANIGLSSYYVVHTITIDVKDGKARVVLSDFYYEDIRAGILDPLANDRSRGGMYGIVKATWGKIRKSVARQAGLATDDFKNYMRQSQNDDF